jgi:hypothetical protein
MRHTRRWPTDEEICVLQKAEYKRAEEQDDYADPICSCGQPGFACMCDKMAMEIGWWPDGEPYEEESADEMNDEPSHGPML